MRTRFMSELLESATVQHVVPFIREEGNSKSLHFSVNLLQSRMHNSRPDELDLDYTRTMMGFLILNPQPRHVAMIGLGGGSLAKYCYRHLPAAKITVVEINPHVIALRKEFLIPDDNERFTVIEANGADYVRTAEPDIDVLLVDGYDHRGQPPQLCSQDFYENCRGVLTDQGVMAVNLHDTHPLYELFIDRIGRSFDHNIAEVYGNRDGNVIVFAGHKITISPHSFRNNIQFSRAPWKDGQALNA